MKVIKNSVKFLIAGFVILLAICIVIISVFANIMNRYNDDAISRIGTVYMANINEEISLHFQTIIEMRMNHVASIIEGNPPGAERGEQLTERLKNDASLRNFSFLALMGRDGSMEIILGDDMDIKEKDIFLENLNDLSNDAKRLTVAHGNDGDTYILMGVSTEYPMESGATSTALVAGVPVSYFNTMLSLGRGERSLTFSNIIDKSGDYIIKNYDDGYENYFERVRDLFGRLDGKTANEYIAEITQAMSEGEEYTTVFLLGDERRHLYCFPLPNSEWYLLTIMPFGEVENVVGELDRKRSVLFGISTVLIIINVLIVFFLYYRMTRIQIEALKKARNEAEEANRAKSDFLSNMSHDIRTPMNAIVGMTAIASANIDNKEKLRSTLHKISRSNKQLLGLINDILDMSKIESGRMTLGMEPVSLREAIDDIVNIIQAPVKEKDQELEVYIHDIITENVITDSVRLNQVIMNLLSNAAKFTPEEGKIDVELYQESSPKGDNFVRIHLSVKDNGIGMSPEFREKIFESFAREDSKRVRKTQGTGLGMAITKYIIDTMQGTIDVESEQGKGTTFRITVDMEKDTEAESLPPLPQWRILVVDDNSAIGENAVSELNAMGARAELTAESNQAAGLIRKADSSGDGYNMIILDGSGRGMDVTGAVKTIKDAVEGDSAMILVSAYDWVDMEDEVRNAGANGFISKPMFGSTLCQAIRRFEGEDHQVTAETQGSSKDFSNIRILVAEDNDLNWEIAYELFSAEGFCMEHAENGQVCMEKFRDSPVGYYSVILMDLRMPLMTGTEATKAIRAMDRPDSKLPIIAMTADAFAEDIKLCLDSGMNAHIAKPIQPQEVVRAIEKLLAV